MIQSASSSEFVSTFENASRSVALTDKHTEVLVSHPSAMVSSRHTGTPEVLMRRIEMMNPKIIKYLADDRIAGLIAEAAPSHLRSTEEIRQADALPWVSSRTDARSNPSSVALVRRYLRLSFIHSLLSHLEPLRK